MLGSVSVCADSLSEREDQRRQCHSQSQLQQPSQQEELLWPTVRPIPRPSLLDDEANVEPENVRRLLVLGSANVGKTAIINRFLENPFSDKYFPTVEDFHRKVGIVQLGVGDYINTIYHLPPGFLSLRKEKPLTELSPQTPVGYSWPQGPRWRMRLSLHLVFGLPCRCVHSLGVHPVTHIVCCL